MMLANDNSAVFLSVTKTGSTTARKLLSPYGTLLSGEIHHLPRNELHRWYRVKYPNATVEEIEAIPGYAFWRDPVDRFVSACGHMRVLPKALIELFPEMFGDGAPYDLVQYDNLPRRLTKERFDRFPRQLRNKIDALLSDDLVIERLYTQIELRATQNIIWMPSSDWFCWDNMNVLNFHDFENEMRRLIGIFGGDTTIPIPAFNTAPTFLTPLTLPEPIAERIRMIYYNDYAFDPRNPQ